MSNVGVQQTTGVSRSDYELLYEVASTLEAISRVVCLLPRSPREHSEHATTLLQIACLQDPDHDDSVLRLRDFILQIEPTGEFAERFVDLNLDVEQDGSGNSFRRLLEALRDWAVKSRQILNDATAGRPSAGRDSQISVKEDDVMKLVLNESQEAAVRVGGGEISVVSQSGERLGTLVCEAVEEAPIQLSVEEVEELARRMSMTDVKWLTTEEVLASLRQLDAK
jgi:hypothetical protein